MFGQVLFVTNMVSQAQAIEIASHLKVGMHEEDAGRFLATNSLHRAVSIGAMAGWDSFYPLSNGCSLVLDYSPREVHTNVMWGGNGRLERAFIQSNNVNTFSLHSRMRPNKSLQATRDGGSSSATRFTSFGPACLSSGR